MAANFCSHCGTRFIEESKFCSACGSPIQANHTAEEKESQESPITNYLGLILDLTEEQVGFLNSRRSELEIWVRKFKVSPTFLDREKAKAQALSQPHKIISVDLLTSSTPVDAPKVRLARALVLGFNESCEEFYYSEDNLDSQSTAELFTKIQLECTRCGSPDSINQLETCNNCEGTGSLDFEFFWDSEFNVHVVGPGGDPEGISYVKNRSDWRLSAIAFFEENYSVEEFGDVMKLARLKEDDPELQSMFYFMVGKLFVYVDVPFAKLSDVKSIEDEFCSWGLGKQGAAITYHLSLPSSAFAGDLTGTETLLDLILKSAKTAETRIYKNQK